MNEGQTKLEFEWQPIETAPLDNKRRLCIARFNDEGTMLEFDYDAAWESDWDLESERPMLCYFWASANGDVEEPTHWCYEPEGFSKLPNQEPLGSEFEKVLYDNLDSLYETTDSTQLSSNDIVLGLGWIPSEKELLDYARKEELYLFVGEGDYLQIAQGVLELVQIKNKQSIDRVRELEAKYEELLMAVARKFPNETRHETALRYIRQAESSDDKYQTMKEDNK